MLESAYEYSVQDALGTTDVIEFKGLPFTPRRSYFLRNIPLGSVRGLHAHKNLEQFVKCLSGEFRLEVTSDNAEQYQMTQASAGVYVPAGTWRTLSSFSADCVVMVLASQPYDPEDYIHTYKEFLQWRS